MNDALIITSTAMFVFGYIVRALIGRNRRECPYGKKRD